MTINYLMFNLHKVYIENFGFQLANPGSAVGRDTDWAMEPSQGTD